MNDEKKKNIPGKVPRTPMPEQKPEVRRRNFKEVPLGYTAEMAQTEASRCLSCKKPFCREGCPVEVNIPKFVSLIKEGNFIEAAYAIKETNALPAVCGRVCPQESQCESKCVLGKKFDPIAIGRLERFVADYEREHGDVQIPKIPSKKGKKVAIVGSGPSGLTCAGDLVKMGYDVTIFEALHLPGGVLVYGIPEFRLPKAIVKSEVDYLKKLGVNVETSVVVGKTLKISELISEEGFSAAFIGVGAGLPHFMNVPGENLLGVYSANEYLTRINLMKAYKFPNFDTPIKRGKNVAVIGGGNVAMDSARTSLRLGSDNSYIIYRRSREEMPARNEEIHHAVEEGVQFKLLQTPVEVIGNESGEVTGIKCVKMELGEPDESGRRRPVPIKGSEYSIEVDTVIVAIGNGPQPLISQTMPELELNKWGYIQTDENTAQTSIPGVYAGGDIVTGAATVIMAMGAGKKAARSIDKSLQS